MLKTLVSDKIWIVRLIILKVQRITFKAGVLINFSQNRKISATNSSSKIFQISFYIMMFCRLSKSFFMLCLHTENLNFAD